MPTIETLQLRRSLASDFFDLSVSAYKAEPNALTWYYMNEAADKLLEAHDTLKKALADQLKP